MRRLPLLAALLPLLAGLVAGGSAVAGEPAASEAALVRGLQAPLEGSRRAALEDALARGAAGRRWARGWTTHEDPRLRSAGWQVLAALGEAEDAHAARDAMADGQPEVARTAAAALVRLACRLDLPAEPWTPRGALGARQVRCLAAVLADELVEARPGAVPACVERLGEGLVPCLELVLAHPYFKRGARLAALPALAVVGGDDARRALGRALPDLAEADDAALWDAWWRALVAVGPGEGLEAAHALVVGYARDALDGSWGDRPPGLRWRNQEHFFRFLSSCPPPEERAVVAAYLDDLLRQARRSRGRRFTPPLAAEVVRAHLVIAEPDEGRLRDDVLAARPPPRDGWVRWIGLEQLGEVLALLEPYREREGVAQGLAELLENGALPQSVRAWALYLKGGSSREELRRLALDLIDADGAAATTAQRRLGALLLDRLGTPAVERIRQTLAELDGWMRAMGLRWLQSAAEAGQVTSAERTRAVAAGLLDEDPGVFLLASELSGGGLPPVARARVLELAVAGPRTWRARAWRVIGAGVTGEGSPPEEAFRVPVGNPGLDARLRAAARAREAWEADR